MISNTGLSEILPSIPSCNEPLHQLVEFKTHLSFQQNLFRCLHTPVPCKLNLAVLLFVFRITSADVLCHSFAAGQQRPPLAHGLPNKGTQPKSNYPENEARFGEIPALPRGTCFSEGKGTFVLELNNNGNPARREKAPRRRRSLRGVTCEAT